MRVYLGLDSDFGSDTNGYSISITGPTQTPITPAPTQPVSTQPGQTTTTRSPTLAPCVGACCIDANRRGLTCSNLNLGVSILAIQYGISGLSLRWNRCSNPEQIELSVTYNAGSGDTTTTLTVDPTVATIPIVTGVNIGLTNVQTSSGLYFQFDLQVIFGIGSLSQSLRVPGGPFIF